MKDTDAGPALPRIRPPSLRLLLLELRVFGEWPRFALRTLSIHGLPRGDGHAVLVLPGFGASDFHSGPLRRALRRLGYHVSGWGFGRNLGMNRSLREGLAAKLADLHARHGRVSLIGWSLGGVFARELARHTPEKVRDVFTLGSPINGHPRANNLDAIFRLVTRQVPSDDDTRRFLQRRAPPPVPCTAIYTRTDGIVAWPCCLENEAPNTCNVEVRGSHMGLVVNAQVLRELTQRLVVAEASTAA